MCIGSTSQVGSTRTGARPEAGTSGASKDSVKANPPFRPLANIHRHLSAVFHLGKNRTQVQMRAKPMLVRWTFSAPICTCMHKGDRSIRRPDEVSMADMPTALPCTAIPLLCVFRDCQLVICVMIKYPEDLAALDQSIVFGKSYHSSTDLSWVPSAKYADLTVFNHSI